MLAKLGAQPNHSFVSTEGMRGFDETLGLPRPIRDALVSWSHGKMYKLPSHVSCSAFNNKGIRVLCATL